MQKSRHLILNLCDWAKKVTHVDFAHVHIGHVNLEGKKPAWIESDLCVSCITTLFTMDNGHFCLRNLAEIC